MKLSIDADIEQSIKVLVKGIHFISSQVKNKAAGAGIGFENYLYKCAARLSKFKTIISTNIPAELHKEYVPLEISCNRRVIPEDELIRSSDAFGQFLIEASGGAGKSIYLRWLFFRFIDRGGAIPLFLELRKLNSYNTPDLVDLIVDELAPDAIMSADAIRAGFEKNAFVLLLDGFDEVDFDQRGDIAIQINELVQQYPHLKIIVTSRPGEEFEAWPRFYRMRVRPLSLGKVKLLISKIECEDSELKDKFIEEIETSLFDSHRFFLETPLLAQMMFLTRSTTTEISQKKHLFYRQTYEALYQRHDALKGVGFKRKRKADFDIDEFAHYFSVFCCSTYMNSKFSFSDNELLSELTSSLENFTLESDHIHRARDFMDDILEAACLMVREGDNITFAHRSFQEYFTAFFLASICEDGYEEIVSAICVRKDFDTSISMIALINRSKFEKRWVAKMLPSVMRALPKLGDPDLFEKYWAALYPKVTIRSDQGHIGVTMTRAYKIEAATMGDTLFAVWKIFSRIYFRELRGAGPDKEKQDNEVRKTLKMVARGELRSTVAARKAIEKAIEFAAKGKAIDATFPLYEKDLAWQKMTWIYRTPEQNIRALYELGQRIEDQKNRKSFDIRSVIDSSRKELSSSEKSTRG